MGLQERLAASEAAGVASLPHGILPAGFSPRRILIVKLSALGDQIMMATAVSDIHRRWPLASIDWAVDERFATIPRMHRHVARVIALPLKRAQGKWREASVRAELRAALAALREQPYDLIIDAQGLWKSALIARLARGGPRVGFAARHCGEKPAARLYPHHCTDISGPGCYRLRDLAAYACGSNPAGPPEYGLSHSEPGQPRNGRRVGFFHCASKPDRLWDESQWVALGKQLAAAGWRITLPWGCASEQQGADSLARAIGPEHCLILPYTPIEGWPAILQTLELAFGVDSGLLHLAAAHYLPTVGIFTNTSARIFNPWPGQGIALGGDGHAPDAAQVLAAAAPWLARQSQG